MLKARRAPNSLPARNAGSPQTVAEGKDLLEAVCVGKFLDLYHALEKAAESPNAMRVMNLARITKDDHI